MADMGTDEPAQSAWSRVDTSVPHSARVWNYWLGGKDNFPADRELGDKVYEVYPDIVRVARAQREFLVRAVTYLAGEAGIRQFLDIGTGLPSADNTHEVAQRIAPESRTVYVDNDPLVLVHARALLTSAPGGATAYVDADVRDPDAILAGAAEVLDFSQPVALVMFGIVGNVADNDEATSIVTRLREAVSPGSYLVLNDGTHGEDVDKAIEITQADGHPYNLRTPEQVASFFDGLELVEPGVVSTPFWRPPPATSPEPLHIYGGIGRKR
ncbi:O-methyltransferase involved in polyketide biosynthesis [Frankia sp. AiPs1]|uniref:SAM-dependent methyltransferase n=1 Tax=Frankia sp. AiPa1 TaxID=573492 RepID=UPI00202B16EB|nr:SAM-dependent methyltransferase [Frankia sp. AiPa1]MCL9761198.1 SAM-dependent methyltransferase [Frankia sp. AiPa1]